MEAKASASRAISGSNSRSTRSFRTFRFAWLRRRVRSQARSSPPAPRRAVMGRDGSTESPPSPNDLSPSWGEPKSASASMAARYTCGISSLEIGGLPARSAGRSATSVPRGPGTTHFSLAEARKERTSPVSRRRIQRSGSTVPSTSPSFRPHTASTTARSGSEGLTPNTTPERCAETISWTSTAISLPSGSSPSSFRYSSARSDHREANTCRTRPRTAEGPLTFRNDSCSPANEAFPPSSPGAEERTATGRSPNARSKPSRRSDSRSAGHPARSKSPRIRSEASQISSQRMSSNRLRPSSRAIDAGRPDASTKRR